VLRVDDKGNLNFSLDILREPLLLLQIKKLLSAWR
jgi:hypothetical protein